VNTLHVVAWLAVAVILAWRVVLPLWRHWRAPVVPPRVYPPMPHLNKWKVSNRARWYGSRMRFAMPTGESADFTTAQAASNADLNRILTDLDVTIMDICEGLPNLVQTDDGFRFDPRVDIELLETGGGA
jgi:hypothetical protein